MDQGALAITVMTSSNHTDFLFLQDTVLMEKMTSLDESGMTERHG